MSNRLLEGEPPSPRFEESYHPFGAACHPCRCRTCIENPLASGDGLSGLEASRAFGAIVKEEENRWVVQGRGGILQVPSNVLDTGNSGTTTCLFTSGGLLGVRLYGNHR
jgi:5-enolpyruvylshikimate-3-phosphate synthase